MRLLRERLHYFIEKHFPNSPRVKQILHRAWLIQRLDTKLKSRGLISYRRLVVSCTKMALHGSIIVEICDETKAKCDANQSKCRVSLPVCCSFSEFLVAALIFGVCFSLPFLACSDEDP